MFVLNEMIDRIKELKKSKKMTNQQLSQQTGIPKSTIDKILTGVIKDPAIASIAKIATALSVTPDYLITGHEDKYIFDLTRVAKTISNAIDEHSILDHIIRDKAYFSEDELEIISTYRSLNESGKKKALEYIFDLKTIEKYTNSGI